MMQVVVPAGAAAGQPISITTPTGQLMQVVVPAGLNPGDAFMVEAGPAAPPSASPAGDMQVIVPANTAAGQPIQITTPTGQLMQVVVPAGLNPGDAFMVKTGPTAPSASPAGATLARLGAGGRMSFGFTRALGCHVSQTGMISIAGSIPVKSDGGRNVATLMFESAQKGRHLSASLVLPSGETIATFQRGTPPGNRVAGILSSIGQDWGPAAGAPVAIALLGQPYGFFNAFGSAGSHGVMGGILDGTELRYVDGSRSASTPPQPLAASCSGLFCNARHDHVSYYKFTPAKKSNLGKKEAPLQVFSGATTAPAGGIVHLILPNLKWYQGSFFPLDEVLCELGSGLGDQQKLDVLLMGAAMAAMCATEKQPRGGGP